MQKMRTSNVNLTGDVRKNCYLSTAEIAFRIDRIFCACDIAPRDSRRGRDNSVSVAEFSIIWGRAKKKKKKEKLCYKNREISVGGIYSAKCSQLSRPSFNATEYSDECFRPRWQRYYFPSASFSLFIRIQLHELKYFPVYIDFRSTVCVSREPLIQFTE